MYLRSHPRQAPGQRQRTGCVTGPQPALLGPRFRVGHPTRAGRGQAGTRTVLSKGRRAGVARFQPLYAARGGVFTLSTVVRCLFAGGRGAAVATLRSAAGAWWAAPLGPGLGLLAFAQATPPGLGSRARALTQPHWWALLGLVAPYAQVHAVSPGVGVSAGRVTLARAVGSVCRVLVAELGGGWALLALPSGQLRLVANASYVSAGAAGLVGRQYWRDTRAGASRRAGWAPCVRGVVKNPNDHPHGGRTRAVRYPRTPWGRTAKASRPPRAAAHLRPLAKRQAA